MIKNYCKLCSTLVSEDIEKISQLTETVSMISGILGADVFINCETRDKEQAMVVYHARPKKNSLYSKNIQGELAKSVDEPAVFRSFLTGQPSNNYKALSQEKKQVLQNIIPIKNDYNETVAVVIIEVSHKRITDLDTDVINTTTRSLLNEISSSKTRLSDFIKDGIITFNNTGKVVYANSVSKKIYAKLGITNIIGKDYENLTLTKDNIEDIIKNEKNRERKEITIPPLTLEVSYYITKLENTEIVMIVQDITKERDNEKELMLKSVAIKEIHHRVKNNLQTVASLLRIQSRRVNNEEAKDVLKDTINRILSIAVTHEILSDNGFDNLKIQTIIKLIYENFSSTYIDNSKKIEFNISGDDYYINSETSTSIALVLNEVLQNTLDHAFYERTEGRVKIETKKEKLFLKVIISDNGVGMNNEEKDSLGFIIIEKIIIGKLNGKFKIEKNKDGGTTVILEFKNI